MSRPNLLLITADSLRREALGCYGSPGASTPHLDALAEEGMLFETCYATSPRVDASARELLGICAGQPAFPHLLAAHGYRCLTLDHRGLQGDDLSNSSGEPFAAHLHLPVPFDLLPTVDTTVIDASRLPAPLQVPHAMESRPAPVRQLCAAAEPVTQDAAPALLSMRHAYFAAVHELDAIVGKLLAQLEHQGQAGNTLVAFTATSGTMLGDHGIHARHGTFYDPHLAVPLILRWPDGFPGGQRSFAITQHLDAHGSMLDVAGVAAAATCCSLLPIARGDVPALHQAVHAFHKASDGSWGAMIRQADHKLTLYSSDQSLELEGELFDLEHDWHELNSLWSLPEYWGVRLAMTQRLLDWLVRKIP